MKISAGKTVSIEYTMALKDGQVIDTNTNEGDEAFSFVQGEHLLFESMENTLDVMKAGDSQKFILAPEDAYGMTNPEALVIVPIKQIPSELRTVGTLLQTQRHKARS